MILMHTQCKCMHVFEHTDIREDVGKRQHRHAFAEEAGRCHFVTCCDVLNPDLPTHPHFSGDTRI